MTLFTFPALGTQGNRFQTIEALQAEVRRAIAAAFAEIGEDIRLVGEWAASSGAFPTSPTPTAGSTWIVTAAGTVDGIAFIAGDKLTALGGGGVTYAGNWLRIPRADLPEPLPQTSGGTGASSLGAATVTPTGGAADSLADHLGALYARSGAHVIRHPLAASNTIADGSLDSRHRHFGQCVRGQNGVLHLFYRRGTQHGVSAGTGLYYRTSRDGGATWTAEAIRVAPVSGIDLRAMSACVTPSGRIVLIYDHIAAPSAAPSLIRLTYSDDDGATWVQGANIASIPYAYSRSYGRIKVIPGASTAAWRLAFTPYYQVSATPTYRVACWTSSDDGATWTEGAAISEGTAGDNEAELVAIDALNWLAVARSGDGLKTFRTVNGGVSWSSVGVVPLTSTDNFVAPTLDRIRWQGDTYVALAYCNRTNSTGDEMVWRLCLASEAMAGVTNWSAALIYGEGEYQNASGYQCPITTPDGDLDADGGVAWVEFQEFDAQTYSTVRWRRVDLLRDALSSARSVVVASDAITVSASAFEANVFLDTESSAATDDLVTINGGYEGQTIAFKSGTASRDVIFRSGTGNLRLFGDYRLSDTASRIVLRKLGANWIEVARSTDVAAPAAYVIAAGVVTIANGPMMSVILVDTEGGAATDDLDTINGGLEAQTIVVTTATSSRDVTLKDGTGNLRLAGDFLLTNSTDTITLIRRGAEWLEIARSDNA